MDRQAQERLRYQVLEWLHQQVGRDRERVVSALGLGQQLGVAPEAVFAVTEYLARHEYIGYRGAGPRICITDAGLRYLESQNRRRSVRELRDGADADRAD